MYEEEDDDLPMQYRRLTAHLQTGSADFNRRLAAYLTNHVAMRSALDQAINDSYAQQFPHSPTFAQNPYSMFPSPIVTQGLPMAPPGSIPQSAPPKPSSHPYRQSPYPMQGEPEYRPSQQPQHKRSASMASPYQMQPTSQGYASSPREAPKSQLGARGTSVPAASTSTPTSPLGAGSRNEVTISTSRSSPFRKVASPVNGEKQNVQHQASTLPNQSRPDGMHKTGISPLTMTLPQDSQMLLGSALNQGDFFSSMLMSNPASNFVANSRNPGKDVSFYPPPEGMNATLAPSALNMSSSEQNRSSGELQQFQNLEGMNNDMHLHLGDLKGVEFVSNNPSNITWDAFINEHSWTENNT